MADPVETAKACWGPEVPDWIMALARACAASSQRRVADRLGRSGSLVNAVLRRRYKGDLEGFEARVRGAYMAATVTCPALGQMPVDVCQDWQVKSARLVSANALRVRMYRACRTCPIAEEARRHD
ncbi:MAG: hypothetical protein AAFW69_05760 [Pseudomonadota bacterium]